MDEITAKGLLLTIAAEREKHEYPYSYQFNMMVQQAAAGEGMMVTEAVACRKLEDDEGAAVNAIFSALSGAVRSGSGQAIMDVAAFGLPLIAKWAEYLVVLEQHPRLAFSHDDED